jgi:hypothetical protein
LLKTLTLHLGLQTFRGDWDRRSRLDIMSVSFAALTFGSESTELCMWTCWSFENIFSGTITQSSLDLDLPNRSPHSKAKTPFSSDDQKPGHERIEKRQYLSSWMIFAYSQKRLELSSPLLTVSPSLSWPTL